MTLGNFFVFPNSGERVSDVASDNTLSELSPTDSSVTEAFIGLSLVDLVEVGLTVELGFRRSLSAIDEGGTTGF